MKDPRLRSSFGSFFNFVEQETAEPWPYDRVPELVEAYAAGQLETYFPLIRVNP